MQYSDDRGFSPIGGHPFATPLVAAAAFAISFTLTAASYCLLSLTCNSKEFPMNAHNVDNKSPSRTKLILGSALTALSNIMVAITAGVGLG